MLLNIEDTIRPRRVGPAGTSQTPCTSRFTGRAARRWHRPSRRDEHGQDAHERAARRHREADRLGTLKDWPMRPTTVTSCQSGCWKDAVFIQFTIRCSARNSPSRSSCCGTQPFAPRVGRLSTHRRTAIRVGRATAGPARPGVSARPPRSVACLGRLRRTPGRPAAPPRPRGDRRGPACRLAARRADRSWL